MIKKYNILLISALVILTSCMKYYAGKMELKDQRCIAKSKEWILKNAMLPDTYVPLYFKRHEESRIVQSKGIIVKTVPNTACYTIIHKYIIADSNGFNQTCYSKFYFDPQFKLKNIYSTLNDSNFLSVNTDTSEWLKNFGKKF